MFLILLCLSIASGGLINSPGNLASPRRYNSAVTNQGLLYFSGYDSTTNLTSTDVFNISTTTPISFNLRTNRTNFVTISVDNLIIFAGGNDGTNVLSSVEIYNTQTQVWIYAKMQYARENFAATTLGDRFVLFGGGEAQLVDTIDVYDAKMNKWSLMMQGYTLQQYLSACTIGAKAVFAGGSINSGTVVYGWINIFDIRTNTRVGPNSLSQARDRMSCTSVGPYVIFAGGRLSTNECTQLVDLIDMRTNGRSSSLSLSVGRCAMGAITVGSKAIFAGGMNISDSSVYSVVDIYDVLSQTWQTDTLTVPRAFVAVATTGYRALFAGGVDSAGSPVATLDLFANCTSCDVGYEPDALCGCTSCPANCGRCYQGVCLICSAGFYFNQSQCQPCGSACDWCVNSTTCSFCQPGYVNNFGTCLISYMSVLPDMTHNRQYHAAVAVDNLILIAGGASAAGAYADIDVYNLTTLTKSVIQFPSTRQSLQAATYGSIVVFLTNGNTVDILDTRTWTFRSRVLPLGRFAITAVGSKILLAGGFDYGGVDIYDALLDQWSSGAFLNVTGFKPTACGRGNLAIFYMGQYWGGEMNSGVKIYDLSSDQWTSTQFLPPGQGSYEVTCTSVGPKIMFAGGRDHNYVFLNNVTMYDVITRSWSTSRLSLGRTNVCGATIGLLAFFAGGWASGGSLGESLIDVYNVSNGQWRIDYLSAGRLSPYGVGNRQYAIWAGGLSALLAGYDATANVDLATGCDSCTPGFEPTNECTCRACPSNCEQCYNSQCFFCQARYYLDSGNVCQACSPGCIWCNDSACNTCDKGWQGVNGTCQDVDECAITVSLCSTVPNSECVNLPGSFECQCITGYIWNGTLCEAVCGDGIVAGNEECDGANFDGASCQSRGYLAGTLNCSAACRINTSACVYEVCGDGMIHGSEECDGLALNGVSCITLGYTGGAVTCSSTCLINSSACFTSSCGDGIVGNGEDCDGVELNGNSCETMGYMMGPLGCSSTCRFDESACVDFTPCLYGLWSKWIPLNSSNNVLVWPRVVSVEGASSSIERRVLAVKQRLELTPSLQLLTCDALLLNTIDPAKYTIDYRWTRVGGVDTYTTATAKIPYSLLNAGETVSYKVRVGVRPVDLEPVVRNVALSDFDIFNVQTVVHQGVSAIEITNAGYTVPLIGKLKAMLLPYNYYENNGIEYEYTGAFAMPVIEPNNTSCVGGIIIEDNYGLTIQGNQLSFGSNVMTVLAGVWYNYKVRVLRQSDGVTPVVLAVTAKVWARSAPEPADTAAWTDTAFSVPNSVPIFGFLYQNYAIYHANISFTLRYIYTERTQSITILSSSIVPVLNTPSQLTISRRTPLTINASASIDYNIIGLPNQSQLMATYVTYDWSCVSIAGSAPCVFTKPSLTTNALVTQPQTQAGKYRYDLVITSTYVTTRSATVSVVVEYVEENIPPVAIRWVNSASTNLLNQNSNLQFLAVNASNRNTVLPVNFLYQWKEISENLFAISPAAITSSSSRSLSLNTSYMLPGKTYTLQLLVNDPASGLSANTSLTLPAVNSPPSAGVCTYSSSIAAVTSTTLLTINCSGWVDLDNGQETLRYNVYALDTNTSKITPLVLSSLLSVVTVYLPVGNINIYATVVDSNGASSTPFVINNIDNNSPLFVVTPPSTTDINTLVSITSTINPIDQPSQFLTLTNVILTSLPNNNNNNTNSTDKTFLTNVLINLDSIATNHIDIAITEVVISTLNILTNIINETLSSSVNNDIQNDLRIINENIINILNKTNQVESVTNTMANTVVSIISQTIANIPCDIVNNYLAILRELSAKLSSNGLPESDPVVVNSTGASSNSGGIYGSSVALYANEGKNVSLSGLELNLTAEMLSQASEGILGLTVFYLGSVARCRVTQGDSNNSGSQQSSDVAGPVVDISLHSGVNTIESLRLQQPFSFVLPFLPLFSPQDLAAQCDAQTNQNLRPTCGWWNRQTSSWDTSGCTSGAVLTDSSGKSYLECSCNHLTEFALLMMRSEEGCSQQVEIKFVVTLIIYLLLGVITTIQLLRVLSSGSSLNDPLLQEHLMVMLVCWLRSVESAYFANLFSVSIPAIAIFLSLPYMFVFWIFFILVFQWANIYHLSLGELKSGQNKLRPLFLFSGIVVSVVILALFVSFLSVSSLSQRRLITLVASIIVGLIYVLTGGAFMFYGRTVAVQLRNGMSMTSRPSSASLSTDATADTLSCFAYFEQLHIKMQVIAVIVASSFIGSSAMWICSAVFIEKAIILSMIYYLLEAFSLSSILALFSRTIGSRMENRRKSSRSKLSRSSTREIEMSS